MTADLTKLDICIVSWRTRDLLRQCLHSVVGQPETGEVVVVDNDSRDGTVEMVRSEFPTVKLIANDRNAGFAAGNNQAIRQTGGHFVLLLNPDTEVQRGAFQSLLQVFAEDSRVAAVAPQLLLPDGSVQLSCRSFPDPGGVACELLILARLRSERDPRATYRLRGWAHDTREEVDQPMASALALRRAALDQVGLFDEAFPLYFNDVDLCFRLKEAGWRILFEPAAKIVHVGGSATRLVRPAAIVASHESLIRFYRKHYRGRIGWWPYLVVVVSAWLTMWPRAGLAWLLGIAKRR